MGKPKGRYGREHMSQSRGQRTSFNGAEGSASHLRQGYGAPSIEGKAARVAVSEWSRGDASDIDEQTETSNEAFGESDIESRDGSGERAGEANGFQMSGST